MRELLLKLVSIRIYRTGMWKTFFDLKAKNTRKKYKNCQRNRNKKGLKIDKNRIVTLTKNIKNVVLKGVHKV